MIEIKEQSELNKVLLENFTKLKCLVFLSDDLEVSTRFEERLKAAQSEFPKNVQLLTLHDSPQNDRVFDYFGVDSVPSLLFLNANLAVVHKLSDVSPAEVIVFAKGFEKTFGTNIDLENAKYDEIFPRYLLPDRFVFFEFAAPLNPELAACKKLLEERQISLKSLSIAPFKEQNPLTVLAHLIRKVEPTRKTVPFCYVNGRLIGSVEELEAFLGQNQALVDKLKDTEAQSLEALLKKNPVLLIYDSAQHKDAKEALIEEFQKKKVMFSMLDTCNKPFLRNLVEEKTKAKAESWPVLFVESQTAVPHDRILSDLEKVVDQKYRIENTDERIKSLIASHDVFIFMKGSPEFPQCGFTRQIVELLAQKRVNYGSYSILSDPELRERLKEISNWKTYPQVYIKGELIGGLDIVREMDQAGELDPLLKPYVTS